MRVVLIAAALVVASAVCRAEDMVDTNPNGIMCKDEKALADFTAPDGSAKSWVMAKPFSASARRFEVLCQDAAGATVHVVRKRKNTTIVTVGTVTWFVPNIDFFTPTPDCIKDGSHVRMTGRIESGFAQTNEVDPTKGYHYPRLMLDAPVCYLGNLAEKAGRYVSLPATSGAGAKALMGMIGQHVTVTGTVGSPDNGNQPPDDMMMFDPAVERVP